MPITFQLQLDGSPVPADLYTAAQSLEVEENADAPDALLLRLPVNRTLFGDLSYIGDGTVEPYTTVSLVVTPAGQPGQCIFDGYVLAWKLHLDRTVTASTVDVWAQDASWLMNVDEQVREWSGLTDGEVANAIFADYGFTPADGNTDDDSPAHQPDDHSLFQRDTDLRFLRDLARRNGRILRVTCAQLPGARTGYFVTPSVSGSPAATFSLVDAAEWSVDSLDIAWDVMRPTAVATSQISFSDDSGDGVPGDTGTSGLDPMDARDLAAYSGRSSTALLTAAADPPELSQRAAGLLREAAWLARCTGTVDAERIGTVLRVGSVVQIQGAGTLHSGNWFVWSVRHILTQDAYRMRFTLLRNAMGPPAAGGGLAAGLGALGGVMAVDEQTIEEMLARLRNRFYGKYRGTVTDVDPQTCRVKATVPSVLGDTQTGWCIPCVPYAGPKVGIAFLPETGSGVWIEFEGGDVSYPIWVGCYWRDGEVPDGVDADVKVIATASAGGEPLVVTFDNDQQSITISDPNENSVTADSSGITLARSGQQLVVSDSSVSANDGAWQVS